MTIGGNRLLRLSGAAMLSARASGGEPAFMPSLIVDKTTGTHLAMGILGALLHRARTGQGQFVEVPMLETITSFWLTEHLYEFGQGEPIGLDSRRGVGGHQATIPPEREARTPTLSDPIGHLNHTSTSYNTS